MAEEKKEKAATKKKLPSGRHLSAIKRHRQNVKRNERNSQVRAAVRTAIKRVTEAVKNNDATAAKTLLSQAVSKLNKAGNKGLFHHRHSSRHIGRLSAMVGKISS